MLRLGRRPRRPAAAIIAATLVAGLSACAPTVALTAADDAADPACASVSVALPDDIDGHAARTTNAQATGAWGDPVVATLRCGVPRVEVSDLLCVQRGDVYWLIDDSAAPEYRFTSYGRVPAVEVIVDYDEVGGSAVVDAVSDAVATLPTDGLRCLDLSETDPDSGVGFGD